MALTQTRPSVINRLLLGPVLAIGYLHGANGRAQAGVPELSSPAWMTYTLRRTVDQGSGAYEGYADSLTASGRYDLVPDASHLAVTASYAWLYQGETCDRGEIDRSVRVRLADRLYEGSTDLDDYDDHVGPPLATWLWIPPTAAPGSVLHILERDFTVVGTEQIIAAGLEVSAIRATSEDTGRRDDAYGSFATTFVDTYWFDGNTGYFLRSEYRELNRGLSEGVAASFVWTEIVEVTGASYIAGTTPTLSQIGRCGPSSQAGHGSEQGAAPGSTLCCSIPVLFGVGVALVLLATLLSTRRAREMTIDGEVLSTRPVLTLAELPPIAPEDAPLFHLFLPHLVDQALRANHPVYVAQLSRGRVVGLGIADREAQLGSNFPKHPDACEMPRRAVGGTEFLTEHRHEVLPSVVRTAREAGRSDNPPAYNVFETYDVLTLTSPTALSYDTALVSRMTEADLPEIAALSAVVYGVRGEQWLAAALATEELGFVARIDGKLVGYAFAALVAGRGRLHGNTVSPDHRGKGIGRELARARVATCAALGATDLLTEVATWNVASLEVMRSVGFEKTGSMWIESASAARVERKVLRR